MLKVPVYYSDAFSLSAVFDERLSATAIYPSQKGQQIGLFTSCSVKVSIIMVVFLILAAKEDGPTDVWLSPEVEFSKLPMKVTAKPD